MRIVCWVFFSVLANLLAHDAFSDIVFTGIPSSKVIVSESSSSRIQLSEQDAFDSKVIITKAGEKYFWSSRGNTELSLVRSGAFWIFLATNGSGYVRIVDQELRDIVGANYSYVEHLPMMLNSVTYYGRESQ